MKLFPIFLVLILLFGCTQPPGSGGTNVTAAQNQGQQVQNQSAQQQQNQTTGQTQQQNQTSGQAQQYNLNSQAITYKSEGWTIYGTLYMSKDSNPSKAVLLLPGLGQGRDSYPQSFIFKLHEAMPDAIVLAIDMRGNGQSTNLGGYSDFQQSDFMAMKSDARDAIAYLKTNHPTVTSVYAVGASIGSTAAILHAQQERDIEKLAMLSPGTEYQGLSIDSAVQDYTRPLFLAASRQDYYSAQSANNIYSNSDAAPKTLKIYEGSAHGTDMFNATKNDAETLETALVNFFKYTPTVSSNS